MDRDTFIIMVYCLVVEHYRALAATYIVRRGGFPPALTDEEVITMEICGEYFKHPTDKDLFAYFRDHYRPSFPRLVTAPALSGKPLTCGRSKPGFSTTSSAPVGKPQTACRSLTPSRCRSASGYAACATDVSRCWPTMVSARPSNRTTTGSSSACESRAAA